MAAYYSSNSAGRWTAEQNRQFEEALVRYHKDTPNRWHNIARQVDGKTADQVKRYYEELEKDINSIENDQVPIPNYTSTIMPPNNHRLLKNLKLR